jgi:hypothetical protein
MIRKLLGLTISIITRMLGGKCSVQSMDSRLHGRDSLFTLHTSR